MEHLSRRVWTNAAHLEVEARGILVQHSQWGLVLSARQGSVDLDQVLAAGVGAEGVGVSLGLL